MKKLVCVTSFLVMIFLQVSSQTDMSKAKAIFIYNFTRYIEWQNESPTDNFVISIYGSTQIFDELTEYVKGKMVGKRAIVLKKVSGIDQIENCNMLFVGFGKSKEIKTIKTKLATSKTLIISDREGSLNEGAVINFVLNGDKLSYEIKTDNAPKSALKFSSSILNFAYSKS